MKKLKFLFLIVNCVLVIPSTRDCLSQWVQVHYGKSNTTVRSLESAGNNIFAGKAGDGIYISINNGESWAQTSLCCRFVNALASNGNYIFAGTSTYGVYLSTNNGANWIQTSLNNQNVHSLEVSGNNIFAGTYPNNGVYISTNNGASWIQTSLCCRNIHALAANGNNIFAGTYLNFGVYSSTNNGTSWSKTSLNNRTIHSLDANGSNIFAGVDTTGVYLSTDNGSNWSITSLNNRIVFAILANGNTVFAGTLGYGVYISNDNGVSWIQRNEGLGNSYIYAFCISNNYIFASTGTSVYRRPLSELTGINLISSEIPSEFNLEQNYPNPFNPSTNIKFQIPKSGFVNMVIYDILGCEMATLVNEELKPGTYEVSWDAANYPSGVYFYRIKTPENIEVKKMILIK